MPMFLTRRDALKGAAMLAAMSAAGPARAQAKFFRIGTGGTGGTYYPVGGMIANAVVRRQAQRQRRLDSRIGGEHQRHRRRLDGIRLLAGRRETSGPTPEPVSTRASPRWKTCARSPTCTRSTCTCRDAKASASRRSADLKGKRVSLLENRVGLAGRCAHHPRGLWPVREGHQARVPQSGAGRREDEGRLARRLLPAAVIRRARSSNSPPPTASSWCRSTGPEAAKLREQFKFFAADVIPAGTYKGVPAIKTLAVGAQWVTIAKQPMRCRLRDDQGLVERRSPRRARCRPCQGQVDPKENALQGMGIPFHPGAEKFYKEAGLLK